LTGSIRTFAPTDSGDLTATSIFGAGTHYRENDLNTRSLPVDLTRASDLPFVGAASECNGRRSGVKRPQRGADSHRRLMVDTQLRRANSELRVLKRWGRFPGMSSSLDMRQFAYPTSLPIGDNQTISQPYVVTMFNLAGSKKKDRIRD
jgi:hypothetical protein